MLISIFFEQLIALLLAQNEEIYDRIMKENWSSRMDVDSKTQMMSNCFQVKRKPREILYQTIGSSISIKTITKLIRIDKIDKIEIIIIIIVIDKKKTLASAIVSDNMQLLRYGEHLERIKS